MKKLPHYYARRFFTGSVLAMAACQIAYSLLVMKEASIISFILFPAAFWGVYRLEYRLRIMEMVCRRLKRGYMMFALLPLLFGGIAAVFHHRAFLDWFLPLSFLFCSFALEKEDAADYDSRLLVMAGHCLIFLALSLYLTYSAAAPLTVAVLGVVLLLRLTVHGSESDDDFRKGIAYVIGLLLWIGALSPQILGRMLFIAVTPEDFRIMEDCITLFSGLRPQDLSGLVPYAPGYLAAQYGWLSLIPLGVLAAVMVVSGFRLAFLGLRRHTSTLAVGAWLLLVIQMGSWLLKSCSLVIGFEDSYLLNAFLAVLILQPFRPKFLDELDPEEDPDHELQEVCAIMLLPHSREAAEALASYAYDSPNYTAWAVLLKRFWPFFTEDEKNRSC